MTEHLLRTRHDLPRIIETIQGLDPSKPWIVRINPVKSIRSLKLNRLLWRWNNAIQKHLSEHHGITASAEEIHDALVAKLLPSDTTIIMGEIVVRRQLTRKMNNSELCQYLELLEMYCADELGLQLPKKDDLYYEAMAKDAHL